MSLLRKHGAVLQAWACLALVTLKMKGSVFCLNLWQTVNFSAHILRLF